MKQREKKILIAVDGSERSFEVIRYVSRILPSGQATVVVFHIMHPIPENFLDLEVGPVFHHRMIETDVWKSHRDRSVGYFMQRAVRFLEDAGYPKEKISVVVRERELGVARDIAEEARKGYDALVIGRRGMSEVKELIMGSVANKLVSHLSEVPVWIIGESPDPTKILVAMDNSEGAMRALEHVVGIFGDAHPELLLLNAIRGFDVFDPSEERSFVPLEQKGWMEKAKEEFREAEKEMMFFFEECLNRVKQKGANISRIRTKVVMGGYSRALTIFGEALEGGYGTIVVGRRGLSRVEDFFMGRVSNKILQLCREMAVWVVH